MEDLYVYTCKEGHLIYAVEQPTECEECGSSMIEQVHGVKVNKEKDELPRQS